MCPCHRERGPIDCRLQLHSGVAFVSSRPSRKSSTARTTIYDTSHPFFFGDLNFRLDLPETQGPSLSSHFASVATPSSSSLASPVHALFTYYVYYLSELAPVTITKYISTQWLQPPSSASGEQAADSRRSPKIDPISRDVRAMLGPVVSLTALALALPTLLVRQACFQVQGRLARAWRAANFSFEAPSHPWALSSIAFACHP